MIRSEMIMNASNKRIVLHDATYISTSSLVLSDRRTSDEDYPGWMK